jgi:hypothetical protein
MAERFPDAPKHEVSLTTNRATLEAIEKLQRAPSHRPVRRGFKFTDRERQELVRQAEQIKKDNLQRLRRGERQIPFTQRHKEALQEHETIELLENLPEAPTHKPTRRRGGRRKSSRKSRASRKVRRIARRRASRKSILV